MVETFKNDLFAPIVSNSQQKKSNENIAETKTWW